MSSSCHFAVYWIYSLLHQCFMPNRYISLFKMYLTLLTSQRGALATDAKSCSLWRYLLERPPPAPETGFETRSVWWCGTRGGLTIIVEHVQTEPTDHFNMINWILTKCMGLGKKNSFSWKLLKWIYSVLEKSSSYYRSSLCKCVTFRIMGKLWWVISINIVTYKTEIDLLTGYLLLYGGVWWKPQCVYIYILVVGRYRR